VHKKAMIEFTRFSQHTRGLLVLLLSQGYADYFEYDPDCKEPWQRNWEEYDGDVFDHPDTIGACGFMTCLDGQVIGFASWDPRQFPDVGIIGHNCILPAFRGHSYGKQQVLETLRIFRKSGFRRARVTTGEHPFFEPARKMYRACGFREVRRSFSDPCSKFRTIDYELSLIEKKGRAVTHRDQGYPCA